MRVAILKMASKSQGGLEKYASRIAAAFAEQGADVAFLTNRSPETPGAGIEYVPFPISRWPGFLRLEQFDRLVQKWIRENRPDLVLGMERNRVQTHIRLGAGVHAAFLKSRIQAEGRVKFALCQINPFHRKILELESQAFKYPGLKKIFVNSRMVKTDLLNHYPIDPSKIEVIHNGVEWKEYGTPFASWEDGKREALRKFGLPEGAFHLLFIGNGYRRKGLIPLLQALSEWKYKDFHLSVVGKEKRLSLFQATVERLKLNDRVRFFGPQKEIVPFYKMADCLAIPSFYDPFANVTLESLSFGLFVISSKTNGGHEILTKQNGSVIEDLTSVESILAALECALWKRKTALSAQEIRESVSSFDFSNQLPKLIDAIH